MALIEHHFCLTLPSCGTIREKSRDITISPQTESQSDQSELLKRRSPVKKNLHVNLIGETRTLNKEIIVTFS